MLVVVWVSSSENTWNSDAINLSGVSDSFQYRYVLEGNHSCIAYMLAGLKHCQNKPVLNIGKDGCNI